MILKLCNWVDKIEVDPCEDLPLQTSCPFSTSDIWGKMKAEVQKILKLYEELEGAGETATLTFLTRGGNKQRKMGYESFYEFLAVSDCLLSSKFDYMQSDLIFDKPAVKIVWVVFLCFLSFLERKGDQNLWHLEGRNRRPLKPRPGFKCTQGHHATLGVLTNPGLYFV